MGRHWTGVRGVREYSRVRASRLAGKLAWTRWARTFAGVAGRSALGAVGTVAGLGSLAYEGYMAYKRGRSRSRPRLTVSRKRSRSRSRSRPRSRSRVNVRRPVRVRRPTRRSVPRRRAIVGGAGEYNRKRVRFGRSQIVPAPKQFSKLLFHRRVLQFRGVNPLNRSIIENPVGGFFEIDSRLIGSETANMWAQKLPCYAFCLNGTINNGTTAACGYRLGFSSSGTFAWEPVTGRHNNLAQTTWEKEWASGTSGTESSGLRFIEQKWYDCRLLLRNATAQPTVFQVSIVSFTQEHLDPFQIYSAGNQSYGTTYQQADAKAFWQGLVRADISNPIVPSGTNPKTLSRMVVHKTARVVMQPESTTDEDKFPKTHDLRFLFNDNRVYDYQEYSPAPAVNHFDPSAWVDRTADTFRTLPIPRARKYLLIRAMDTTVTSAYDPGVPEGVDGEASIKNTPSFDLVIRKKEVMRHW